MLISELLGVMNSNAHVVIYHDSLFTTKPIVETNAYSLYNSGSKVLNKKVKSLTYCEYKFIIIY